MASDAGSGSEAGPPDPGLRLLTRVGDFIATHTRFDRGHIALQSSRSETIRVTLRQTFQPLIEMKRSAGAGDLPADTRVVPDDLAVDHEIDSQMKAARAAVRTRMEEWSRSHGDDPLQRLSVRDAFRQTPGVGHVEICSACGGQGKLGCTGCGGSGVVPCAACNAQGSTPCNTCGTKGKLRCKRCDGVGYRLRQRHDGGEPERVGCTACAGIGSTPCDTCHGRGRIVCPECHGQKKTPCPQCSGSGFSACEACEGKGKRHVLAQLTCTIKESWSVTHGAAEPSIAAVLNALTSPEQVMELAESHRSSVEIGGATLSRETIAEVLVTTISVIAADQAAAIHGFGRRQAVRDHADLVGLLLSTDIDRLDATMPKGFQFPPRTTLEMDDALFDVLASPANITIVEAGIARKLDAVAAQFAGGLRSDYVRRAAGVIRGGIGDAYWAQLAGWPALVLALPLLQLPLGLMMRGLGDGARGAVTIGVMLLTIGGVIGAHMWSVTQIQNRLAPSGVPAINRLVDRLKLTRTTLIMGAAWAFLATLVVAGVTAALFPPLR